MDNNIYDNLMGVLLSVKAGEFGINEFIVSLIFSFIASIYIMKLYAWYYRNDYDSNTSLGVSFIIIAPSITSVFYAIQYSLPLSLGLLGALSFVRFRTPIKNPEDIGFILFVIAVALLSAVFRFVAASILISIVTLFVISRASLYKFRLNDNRNISIFCKATGINSEHLYEEISSSLVELGLNSHEIRLTDVSNNDGMISMHIGIKLKKNKDSEILISKIYDQIHLLDNIESFDLSDSGHIT